MSYFFYEPKFNWAPASTMPWSTPGTWWEHRNSSVTQVFVDPNPYDNTVWDIFNNDSFVFF